MYIFYIIILNSFYHIFDFNNQPQILNTDINIY